MLRTKVGGTIVQIILTCSFINNHKFMASTQTIGFLYKVESITLQMVDSTLRTTNSFVTRDIINEINEKLKAQNFKVDEGSLRPKYVDDQLFLEGFAVEIKEPKTVGFLSGR